MALEVVSDMVGVAPREGGADGAHDLLGGLGVKTRYVLLECGLCVAHLGAKRAGEGVLLLCSSQGGLPTEVQVVVTPGDTALHCTALHCTALITDHQNTHHMDWSHPCCRLYLVRMHCMGWVAAWRGVEAPCSKHPLHRS